jgi:hypothetical protein
MSGTKGLHYAFGRLHAGENEAVEHLVTIAARHRTDHEVHHVSRDLAEWSREHVARLADVAADHDLKLDAAADVPGLLARLNEKMAAAVGRRPEPGLLLLEDLRELYLITSANSLAWEMLAQHAQAGHETDILEFTQECHPQTLRQIRWANTMLKTLSPQVLSSL